MLAATGVERKDKHVEYSEDTKSEEKRRLHSQRRPPYVKRKDQNPSKLQSNQSLNNQGRRGRVAEKETATQVPKIVLALSRR